MILAIALIVALFLLAPVLIVIPMSFSTALSFEFPPPSYWLGYYIRYFRSPDWLEPTANSFMIAALTTILALAIAIPAAFAFVRYRFPGKQAANILILFPILVPSVVSALAYYGFLGKLSLTGTIPGVVIAHVALALPVAFLVISAALKGFDRNLERAATTCGAGPIRTFCWVTLPVLRPGIMAGALFAFLTSFNEAVVAIFIAGRDAATLPKKMFESVRLESDPVIAVVSSLLISAVVLGTIGVLMFRKRPVHAA